MEEEHKKDESEKKEKALIKKIALAISHVLECLLCFWGVFLKFWNSKWNPVKIVWEGIKWLCKTITNRKYLALFTFILALFTCFLAVSTCLMALYTKGLAKANNELVNYMRQENEREAKLFVGQAKPLIDVIPIGIVQGVMKDKKKTKICATMFSFVNYSGFPAENIAIDIKYGNNVWISEWLKANIDSERKKKEGKGEGIDPNHMYISNPNIVMPRLESGQTDKRKLEWPTGYTSGELDLKVHVIDKKGGFPVLVRVTWQNEGKHVFEKIQKYKLLCTTTGIGHAFTFIPKGIISQKN